MLHWLLLLGTWDIASSFIGAKCKVQLKTGVSYMVDIEVDNNGVVLAALCKCAAGMGPEARCRRVVIVLPGLTVYRDEGGMKREQTYPTAAAVSCCEEDAWGWDGGGVTSESRQHAATRRQNCVPTYRTYQKEGIT